MASDGNRVRTRPPAHLPQVESVSPAVIAPPARWGLVDREPLSTRVVGLLAGPARPSVVVLGGPAGIGKTQLSREVARRLDPDSAVTVRASLGLAAVPLAALVPLLHELGVEVPGDVVHVELLSVVRSAVQRRREPLVVVVDDAPRLDQVSAALVHQMVHQHGVSMIFTVRDGELLDDSLSQLLVDGTAESVAVTPLSLVEVEELLDAVFGAAVDPATVRALHERSGGNPLYLRELVNGTCAAGAMERGPHGVTLTRAVPSDRLVDLVSRHFDRLGPEQLALLEMLAAAQPLPVDSLGVVMSDLIDLERDGLVTVDVIQGAGQLRLGHPVHEEVLRSMTPGLRWRERQRAAARLLGRRDATSRFRSTCLRVDAGDEVAADDLVEAARLAFGLLDHVAAVRLARHAVDGGADFWGNLVLGGASSALGDLDTASAALTAATAAAEDDESRALAAQRRGIHLAIRMGRPAEALDQAEAALPTISDPQWVRFLSADLAKWRLMAGRPVDDLLVDAFVASDASSDTAEVAARLNEQVFRALVAVMNGSLAEADEAIRAGLPLAVEHPEVLPNGQDLLQLSRFLTLTFSGALAEAMAFGHAGLAGAAQRRGEPEGMWTYALAVMDLHCGRASSAAERSAVAVRRLEWRDFTGLRPVARSLLATALAQLGRLGEAESELDRIDPAAMTDPKVDMQSAQARAWLAVSARDPGRAVEELRDAGRRGMDSQHLCLGALTSYEAVRLGGASEVEGDLVDAAGRSEGILLPTLADHAVAAASKNAGALEQVSLRLGEMGMPLAAADASAQAARVHLRAGHREAARRAARRAHGLTELGDGRRGTESTEATDPLTPREREVALLAARRARSREIAKTLGISIRTVDNHLASVYRKLGVVGRDEMAGALADLGLLD